MLMELEEKDFELVRAAEAAIERCFDAVKWHHTVGAAVRGGSGKIYVGVNVDGIHGSCAEFIAIGTAITAGESEIECVVAVYGKDQPHAVLPPCGNCRQMLFEYVPECRVILSVDGKYQKIPVSELLPYPCV
jgi:cytidine deaminase